MKKFGQFCTAFVLTLVFTLSAFAGDIPFPGSTVQTTSTTSTTSETLTLDATSDSSTSDVVALDPVTEATLSLLQSVASLF